MNKKCIFSIIGVFVAWFGIDWLVHGNLLMETYNATPHLWRPDAEMKCWAGMLSSFIISVAFVAGYCALVKSKSLAQGVKYGLIVGVIVGTGMGLCSYSYMPISEFLAVAWFATGLVKFVVGGAIAGYFCSECCAPVKK